jgi:hypothetical protein
MSALRTAAIALALALACQTGQAALCNKDMTRQACEDEYTKLPKAAKETEAEALEDVGKKAATANTGNANASSSLPTSSFTDFFNLLQTSASNGDSGGDDPEALSFELNECGLPDVPGRKIACQLRARAQQPELYEPLKTALNDADLATRATELDDGLSVTDQVTVGAFFSLVGERWGSGLSPGTIALFTDLKNEADSIALAANNLPSVGAPNSDFTKFLMQEVATLPDTPEDRQRTKVIDKVSDANLTFAEIFPGAMADRVVARFEEFAKQNVALTTDRYNALNSLGRRELAQLLNNQPQLYLGVEYGARSEFAGPDELRAKIGYETGFANVNRYRAYAQSNCAGDGVVPCLAKYLAQPGVQATLKSADRVAVTLEYISHRRYEVSVADTAVAITTPASRSWLGSLAYGRYFDKLDKDLKTRLDIVASYEDVSDDPTRRDRGIATATLTRQISDDWVLAVGLVYATKPEFRGEADKDLSVRLGLNYKFLRAVPGH